jgi:hypothetical protein
MVSPVPLATDQSISAQLCIQMTFVFQLTARQVREKRGTNTKRGRGRGMKELTKRTGIITKKLKIQI